MKKRLSLVELARTIERLGPTLGGVFSYADVCNVIGSRVPLKNLRIIHQLVAAGVLCKIQRGVYTTQTPDLWVLATKLKPGAYISMDSVLAKSGLIGTLPMGSVSAVHPTGRKRTVKTPFGTIRYFVIQPTLHFGTTRLKNGVVIADTEKAYLDLLYYYTKGAHFVIDPRHDVTVHKLNIKKLHRYLRRYRNRKFVRFVKGLTHAIS